MEKECSGLNKKEGLTIGIIFFAILIWFFYSLLKYSDEIKGENNPKNYEYVNK